MESQGETTLGEKPTKAGDRLRAKGFLAVGVVGLAGAGWAGKRGSDPRVEKGGTG